MNARIIAFAAAISVYGAAFAAEPAKPPVSQPDQVPAPRAEIVLASADQLNPGPTQQHAQQAPRHIRVARVTTCRCGDQQEKPEE